MDEILVGDEDCTYQEVRNIIEKSGNAISLYKKLEVLALELGVSDDSRLQIRKLSQDLCPSTVILHELLVSWRGSLSHRATLRTLINSLGNIGLTQLGDELFRKIYGVKRARTSKYTSGPIDLQQFMDSLTKVVILCTPAVSVSYERISETSSIMISALLEHNHFLHVLDHSPQNQIIAVQTENVEDLLNKAIQLKSKIIFITMENYQDLSVKVQSHTDNNNIFLCRENLKWSDLTLDHKTNLQSKCKYLKDIDASSIEDTLVGELLFELIRNPDLQLSDCTIPEPIKYYLPRRVLSRNILSPNIFKTKTDHIFLFSGIERHELSIQTEGTRTDISSVQKLQSSITAKYILLETKLDFEAIAKIADRPVHWLHQKNDKLIWIQSTGGMFEIQNYVDKSQTQFPENEFLDEIESQSLVDVKNKPVCIADTPGMGKTKLLANIGRKLIKHDSIVIFIVISELLKTLKTTWTAKIPKHKTDSLIEVLSMSAQGNLEQHLLEMNLRNSNGSKIVELLCDGLDEASSEDLQLAYDCFQEIQSWKSTRLWITTRPHLINPLENVLNVLGYTISPFDEQDQNQFLERYWFFRNAILSTDKLKQFAKTCITTLKKDMTSKEEDIAGVPLQCLLIAEVFEDEAINFAKPENVLNSGQYFPTIRINSISDLYRKLVETKYKKYFERYSIHGDQIKEEDIESLHIHLSLLLLFPKRTKCFNAFLKKNSRLTVEEVLKVGILESATIIPIPKFIHRTFAEFFVAVLVVNIFKKGGVKSLPTFFLVDILKNSRLKFELNSLTKWKMEARTFRHKVVCYFIDNMIQNMQLEETVNSSLQQRLKQKSSQILNLASGLVYENHINIFKLFGESLKVPNVITQGLVYVAINRCSLPFVKLLCDAFITCQVQQINKDRAGLNKFTQIADLDFPGLLKNAEFSCSPIDVAVSRGSYEIMEYLITEKNYKNFIEDGNAMHLFHHILHDSKFEDGRVISDKIDIIKFLTATSKTGLEHKLEGRAPLLSDNVHMKLLKTMLDLKVDLITTDNKQETILHVAAEYLSCEEYCLLFEMIPTTVLRELVNMKSSNGNTPLHEIVKRHELTEAVLTIFANAGADFMSYNSKRETVIYTACKSNRNQTFITSLLKLRIINDKKLSPPIKEAIKSRNLDAVKACLEFGGVNDLYPNKRPLEIALQYRKPNFKIVKHLISAGAIIHENDLVIHKAFEYGSIDDINWAIAITENVNSRDTSGNTPIHKCLYSHTKFPKNTVCFLKALLEKQADVHIKNKLGYSPLQYVLRIYALALDFDTLLVLEKCGAVNSEAIASELFDNLVIRKDTFESDMNFGILSSCVQKIAVNDSNKKYKLLYLAVKNDCIAAVKYLLLKGLDSREAILETNSYSASSLSVDVWLKIDSSFLERGISEGEEVDAIALLKAALFYGRVDALKVLYGVSCFKAAFKDADLLYDAVSNRIFRNVRFMCECYTNETGESVLNLNYKETAGSLLHLALKRTDLDIAKYLIETHLLDTHLKEPRMRDLIHVGVSQRYWYFDSVKCILDLLIKRDPSLLEEKDTHGRTPLFNKMSMDLLEFLITKGANRHAVDNNGRTVLQTHEEYDYWEEEIAALPKLLK